MPAFERKYVADYMLATFPEGGYQLGFPLGVVPDYLVRDVGYETAARQARPWRPEVDAVKFRPEAILLIEAKVFKTFDALAKLVWYGKLVAATRELAPWWGKEVRLRLVTPRITPGLDEAAAVSGVEVDYYVTAEVLQHAQMYERYWTREYRAQREAKMATRRALGVD